MILDNILKMFYKLNVPKSLIIVIILSMPLFIYLISLPFDYLFAESLAHLAMVYFSIAVLLYLFLFMISNLPRSNNRKKLVTFTRIFIRFHIAVAIVGTILILLHAAFMLTSVHVNSIQSVTGLFTLLCLIGVLFSGYLRKMKSSGKRRRYHRYLAFVFLIMAIIHTVF